MHKLREVWLLNKCKMPGNQSAQTGCVFAAEIDIKWVEVSKYMIYVAPKS